MAKFGRGRTRLGVVIEASEEERQLFLLFRGEHSMTRQNLMFTWHTRIGETHRVI